MSHEYHAVTVWRIAATVDEVVNILDDFEALPNWWPSVYISVMQIREGAADGVGRQVRMHTKGWLPYSLRWVSTLLEPVTESGFAVAAEGDLDGSGRWEFTRSGPDVVLTFDWRVTATKPLLRRLGWLLKPVFAANHRWAMRRGAESLLLELDRRRAVDQSKANLVAAPPGPTFRPLIRR
jgi:Polyketide cyclase / dehydrase and lipid transport